MSATKTIKRYARVALRRIPPGIKQRIPASLRTRVAQLLSGDYSAGGRRPLLSVVIPVYNVEPYVAACLTSVLSQSLRSLEVLVVDDGSTDGSVDIVAQFARSDPRVRTFKQANAGQGPARNMAVAHARGQFLAFLDADDIIPPGTYRYMVKSLQASGSDFSVGSVARLKNGRLAKTAWTEPVHLRDQIGITIDDFPTALLDVIACNRMFRRDFWLEKVGGFPEGIVYEDHLPMVKAYVRARSFDLLAKVTYHWRIREDMTSTGQQKHVLANLSDRVIVKKDAYQVLQNEASHKVLSAWVGRVLDTDFPPYIEHALTADEQYRVMLRDVFAQYRAIADDQALSQVRVQQKILGYLVSKDQWDDLEIVRQHFESGRFLSRTIVRDGRVYLNLAETPLDSLDLPPDVYELGARETSAISCLSGAVWCDSRQLKLTGWSYIRNVDLGARTPQTTAWLTDLSTGARADLAVTHFSTPEATRWSGQFHACVDTSGFETVLDIAALPFDHQTTEQTWQLNVEVAFDGLVRQGRIHQALVGSPLATGAFAHTIHKNGRQGVLDLSRAAGLTLTVRQPQITAVRLGELEKRNVTGRIRSVEPGALRPVTIEAVERSTKEVAEAILHPQEDGTLSFSLRPPTREETSVSGAEWDFRVVTDRGKSRALEWPPDVVEQRVSAGESGRAYWQRLRSGGVRLVVGRPDVIVTAAGANDDLISITLAGPGLETARLGSCTLKTARLEVPAAEHERREDGTVVYSFPIRASEFGLSPVALPSGTYDVVFSDVLGHAHKVAAAHDLATELPFYASTALHRARFVTTKQSPFGVNVQAPFTTEEASNYGAARLRESYRKQEIDPATSVLFQCYLGETATDSQLALHHGLRAERPDLTLYWGVRDLATRVPESGVPLIIGSRSWYEQLASARYLCHNIDFPGFFQKRPHQRFLQTFHGYPFKSMGRTFWKQRRYSPQRIVYECARRNSEWDAILVPSEFCADFYRQEYDYTGEVLVTGYPRSDVLVGEDAAEIRQRTRDRLGLSGDSTAILYAPTYRDQLTTRTFAARRFDELDLGQLTGELDESHVILVRGHNNNQREASRVTGYSRIIDVTDYPEINDLTLAADVAVLDYSSLRFDWALTEKPMIFFVPDMETYFADRPPLFEFSSTAPGPLLRSTDEVVHALQHLDGVTVEYAGAISDFNKAFNELHDGRATQRVIDAFFRS
jgi:CDP-glycerol glycerophosphotransferase